MNLEKSNSVFLSRKFSFAIVLIGAILWGLGGIAGQLLYENSDITTPWLIETRMLFSGVVLVLIAFKQNKFAIFNIFKNKKDLTVFLFYAVFGNYLVQYTYFESIHYTNAATATLLQYLAPSIVLVIMAFKNKRLPSLLEVVCVFVALLGLYFVSTHGNINNLSVSPTALIWCLTSATALALNSVIPVGILKKYDSFVVVGFAMVLGALITQIFFNPYSQSYNITPTAWGYAAFICVFGTAMPFTMFAMGLKVVGSTISSILSNIEPLTAGVVSIIFLGTQVTIFDLIGFVLIIGVAIALALFGERGNKG